MTHEPTDNHTNDPSFGDSSESSDVDEEFVRLVSEAMTDPAPPSLVIAATEIFDLRQLDTVDIAELMEQSAVLSVRSSTVESLTFEGSALVIEIELTREEMIGQLLPPVSAMVVLEGSSGTLHETAASAAGVFRFPRQTERVRLTVHLNGAAGPQTVATHWWTNR